MGLAARHAPPPLPDFMKLPFVKHRLENADWRDELIEGLRERDELRVIGKTYARDSPGAVPGEIPCRWHFGPTWRSQGGERATDPMSARAHGRVQADPSAWNAKRGQALH